MRDLLTPEGYEATKAKLAELESRLTAIEQRTDLDMEHRTSVRRSYKMMIREFLEDILLYEAKVGKLAPPAPLDLNSTGDIPRLPGLSNN